jgi:hypothetical protein
MMLVSPLLFVAAFMFLCALLLIGVIYSRIHWILKAILVASSLGFSTFAYTAYETARGYPVQAQPPKVFRYLGNMVREPSSSSNDPGAIFVWLVDPKGRVEPRAIVIPYSKENRDALSRAKKKMSGGEDVFMSLSEKEEDGGAESRNGGGNQGTAEGQRQGGRGGDSRPYKTKHQVLDIVPPPDTLPKKGEIVR